ncbi:MAG TPA: cupin domain-containing protein [Solirubrobacteraceae bacterium]|nr:cupin domain-containing protein [Solirubrobacteraceae bacterium]
MSEPIRELDELFAASLSGGEIRSDRASLVVVEWRDPGGGGDPPLYIAPLHVHHEDDEAWYVVEGALVVRVGEQDAEVPAGGAVLVPRGTPHTYWNPGPAPTRYVLVMTARIKSLIDALHALTARDPATLEATFREHASEYLGWP